MFCVLTCVGMPFRASQKPGMLTPSDELFLPFFGFAAAPALPAGAGIPPSLVLCHQGVFACSLCPGVGTVELGNTLGVRKDRRCDTSL